MILYNPTVDHQRMGLGLRCVTSVERVESLASDGPQQGRLREPEIWDEKTSHPALPEDIDNQKRVVD